MDNHEEMKNKITDALNRIADGIEDMQMSAACQETMHGEKIAWGGWVDLKNLLTELDLYTKES